MGTFNIKYGIRHNVHDLVTHSMHSRTHPQCDALCPPLRFALFVPFIAFPPFLVFLHHVPRRSQSQSVHDTHHPALLQHIVFRLHSTFEKHRFELQPFGRMSRRINGRVQGRADAVGHERVHRVPFVPVLPLSFPQLLAEEQPLFELVVDIGQILVHIDKRVFIVSVPVQSRRLILVADVQGHGLRPHHIVFISIFVDGALSFSPSFTSFFVLSRGHQQRLFF